MMNAKLMKPLPDSIEPIADVSNVNVFEFPFSSVPCRWIVFPSKPAASISIGMSWGNSSKSHVVPSNLNTELESLPLNNHALLHLSENAAILE